MPGTSQTVHDYKPCVIGRQSHTFSFPASYVIVSDITHALHTATVCMFAHVFVGDRSIILKFSYAHQDASMEYTSNEGKGVHLHTLVDRERKRSNERG